MAKSKAEIAKTLRAKRRALDLIEVIVWSKVEDAQKIKDYAKGLLTTASSCDNVEIYDDEN